MGFDFDSGMRRQLGSRLIERIDEYFSSLKNRPVQPPVDGRDWGHHLSTMPEEAADAQKILDALCSEMIAQGFHIPSGNYFGLVNPAPTYMAVLADALVSALNPQLATMARSQLASRIEAETLQWVASRFGWRKRLNGEAIGCGETLCDGSFTSGGSEANFSALALAMTQAFPRWLDDGVASLGARPVAYASEESHHSLDKAMGLLGLGRTALRRIPVDARLRMDVAALTSRIEADLSAGFRPFCLVATAGASSSGAIDDIVALRRVADRYGMWLHVDGAYGAAVAFSDRYRHLIDGVETADSIAFDPHKWLAMPFALGVVLTRHPRLLERSFSTDAPYVSEVAGSPLRDSYRLGFQWSRRMNSLKLWLTLRVHGRRAYEELIARHMRLSGVLADWARRSDCFELVCEPTLPVVNLRLRLPGAGEEALDAAHERLVSAICDAGVYWISKTEIAGRSALRMMTISYHTDDANVSGFTSAMEQAARSVLGACCRK